MIKVEQIGSISKIKSWISLWQVLPVRRAVPTPPLPLRSEAVPVHRLREEVRPQRSPVETPQSPPLSTKQQDSALCKRTPLTSLWQTAAKRRGGRRGGRATVQTPFKGVRARTRRRPSLFVFDCVRVTYNPGTVIIYWVTRKKTVRTKTENCYLTQHPHRWNKLLVYYNFIRKSFS